MRTLTTLSFLGLLTLAASPASAQVKLPLDLTWCQDRESAEATLPDPSELTEGVVESAGEAWGVDGQYSLVFEDGLLTTFRFRAFETPDSKKKIQAALTKMLGEGGTKETYGGSTTHWSPGDGQTVSLKIQAEQVYAAFEVRPSRCVAVEGPRTELTEQEKADIEGSTKRKAISLDPFAEDLQDVENRKADADEKKRSDEEKTQEEEKKEEDEEAPQDTEIDW